MKHNRTNNNFVFNGLRVDTKEWIVPFNGVIGGTTLDCIIWSLVDTHQTVTLGLGNDQGVGNWV